LTARDYVCIAINPNPVYLIILVGLVELFVWVGEHIAQKYKAEGVL
jgi:hypothetical protein